MPYLLPHLPYLVTASIYCPYLTALQPLPYTFLAFVYSSGGWMVTVRMVPLWMIDSEFPYLLPLLPPTHTQPALPPPFLRTLPPTFTFAYLPLPFGLVWTTLLPSPPHIPYYHTFCHTTHTTTPAIASVPATPTPHLPTMAIPASYSHPCTAFATFCTIPSHIAQTFYCFPLWLPAALLQPCLLTCVWPATHSAYLLHAYLLAFTCDMWL